MWSSLIVLSLGAVLAAAAAFWVLRAYRRAGGGARSARPAIVTSVAVALVGLGVYLAVGRPELTDAPFEERLAALKQRDPLTYTPEENLAFLADAARREPRDPLPHYFTGVVLLGLDRPAEAARAFDAALRRDPQLAEAMLGLGRAIVRIEGGQVTPEALRLFEQAGARMRDPAPWIYQAWAAMEAGDDARARRLWGEALARMGPDDPRRAMARQMISGRAPARDGTN